MCIIFIALMGRVKIRTSRHGLECALGREIGQTGYEFAFGHNDSCVYFFFVNLMNSQRFLHRLSRQSKFKPKAKKSPSNLERNFIMVEGSSGRLHLRTGSI